MPSSQQRRKVVHLSGQRFFVQPIRYQKRRQMKICNPTSGESRSRMPNSAWTATPDGCRIVEWFSSRLASRTRSSNVTSTKASRRRSSDRQRGSRFGSTVSTTLSSSFTMKRERGNSSGRARLSSWQSTRDARDKYLTLVLRITPSFRAEDGGVLY